MDFFLVYFFVATNFFYVNAPVAEMRESPTKHSVVVSQAPFSEQVEVEQQEDEWALIRTGEGHLGWVTKSSLVTLTEPYETSVTTSRLAAHIYGVEDTEYGPILTLPYGSKLHVLDASHVRWIKIGLPDGCEGYIQRGDVARETTITNKADLVAFSYQFLGLPYTWGGRSSFGYDCSGFVQMLYSKIGIQLPRNSKQQILDDHFQTIPLTDLEPGDLIFFGFSEGHTNHVGMYIGNGQMIHATSRELKPWLRISNLSDDEWSGKTGVYTPYRVARQLISLESL